MKWGMELDAYLVSGGGLHLLDDLGLLVRGEQVRNIGRVEDHVDVLEEGLLLDLRVAEEEDGRFSIAARLHKDLLDVVAPLVLAVRLRELDLDELVIGHEGSQLGRALALSLIHI